MPAAKRVQSSCDVVVYGARTASMFTAFRRVFGRYSSGGPSSKAIMKVKDKPMTSLPHISHYVDKLTKDQVRGQCHGIFFQNRIYAYAASGQVASFCQVVMSR